MRALGRKNTCFFLGNARPKSNAHAHLKQRKNIVASGQFEVEDLWRGGGVTLHTEIHLNQNTTEYTGITASFME